MRDISLKTDNTGDTLPASDFNANLRNELQNAVESADFTLDAEGGPDTDLNMLGKTLGFYTNAGATYQDSGAANAYVLSLSTNLKGVDSYKDGMTVTFKAGNENTGASTVNINSIGAKSITLPDGTALSGGEILTSEYTVIVYNLSSDRFEINKRKELGVAQTWQDVSGSRSLSVVYTNTTGRPIYINVGVANSVTGAFTRIILDIDGVTQATQSADSEGANNVQAAVSSVIPDGSTYEVTSVGGTINNWFELR